MVVWNPSLRAVSEAVASLGQCYIRLADQAQIKGDQATAELLINLAYEAFSAEGDTPVAQ